RDIAAQMRVDGFAFDVEMLYLARRSGCRIEEVPIIWVNSPQSKVDPLRDSLKMLLDIISIRRCCYENK
ncbi:MAG: glycosyltransferase family 2 protein, partial [Candidatus Orphnella occulta]|nr:glycosyltransferase family 2 protein [Candidatus Orphnella occulta]